MKPLIIPYMGVWPDIHPDVFLAETAQIMGKVTIGKDSNLWFNVVARGDVHEIKIGERTNVQDGTIIHVTTGGIGTHIGNEVTIGHGAILHDCTLQDACFIGMGAIILDKAVIETGAMVAAGTLIGPGKIVPKGELWAGNPGKLLRPMTDHEKEFIAVSAQRYVDLSKQYKNRTASCAI